MNSIRNISLAGRIRHEAELIQKMTDKLSEQGGLLYRLDQDTLLSIARRMYEDMLLLEATADTSEPVATDTPESIGLVKPFETQESATVNIQPSVTETLPLESVAKPVEPVKEADAEASIDVAVTVPQKSVPVLTSPSDQEGSEPKKTDPPKQPLPTVDKPAVQFVPDLFGDSNPPFIADKLAAQPDNSLAARIGKSKVEDLRKAIGINDKFLFINELFEGNITQYNNAIDELNGFYSLNGALTYLKELSVLFAWPHESAAKDKLCELLERKFGTD